MSIVLRLRVVEFARLLALFACSAQTPNHAKPILSATWRLVLEDRSIYRSQHTVEATTAIHAIKVFNTSASCTVTLERERDLVHSLVFNTGIVY
jgi:hypothetical protein